MQSSRSLNREYPSSLVTLDSSPHRKLPRFLGHSLRNRDVLHADAHRLENCDVPTSPGSLNHRLIWRPAPFRRLDKLAELDDIVGAQAC